MFLYLDIHWSEYDNCWYMMGIERAIIGEFPALIRERKEEIILMHPRLFLADFMDALTF